MSMAGSLCGNLNGIATPFSYVIPEIIAKILQIKDMAK
jgi:hypothetical protein